MKKLAILLLLAFITNICIAQRPITVRTNKLTIKAGDGSADLVLKGGDLTLTKLDIDSTGQNILVADNGTGLVSSIPVSSLSIDEGRLDTVYQSGDTTYFISGETSYIAVHSIFDGQYSSLTGAPTNVSEFTNDAGYLTQEVDGDSTNENQNLTLYTFVSLTTGAKFYNLGISNGNKVWWSDIPSVTDTLNQYQNLIQISDTSFVISGTNDTIVISASYVDSVKSETYQQLSLSNDTLYLSDGGFVVLPSGGGGTSYFEELITDTLTLVDSNDVVYISSIYSRLNSGFQLLNGSFNVFGFDIPYVGALADAYGGKVVVGIEDLSPFAQGIKAAVGWTDFASFEGLQVDKVNNQVTLDGLDLRINRQSDRGTVIGGDTIVLGDNSNALYLNVETQEQIDITTPYVIEDFDSTRKSVGSNYQEIFDGSTLTVTNNSGLDIDASGIGGDIDLDLSSYDLNIGLSRLYLYDIFDEYVSIRKNDNQTDDTVAIELPESSGELLTDGALYNANSITADSGDVFPVFYSGNQLSTVSFSDLASKINEEYSETTLVDQATLSMIWGGEDLLKVTLGGNRTIDQTSGMIIGKEYTVLITQDATGNRTITWGAAYDFGSAGTPTLSTASGKTDMFKFIYDGTTVYGTYHIGFN